MKEKVNFLITISITLIFAGMVNRLIQDSIGLDMKWAIPMTELDALEYKIIIHEIVTYYLLFIGVIGMVCFGIYRMIIVGLEKR